MIDDENPFLLTDIEDKKTNEYTIEDYIKIQKKLEDKKQKIDFYLDKLYPEGGMTTTLYEMKRRVMKGLNAKIIDLITPEKKLHKVGNGGAGNRCFVCCTALGDNRHEYSMGILKSLEEVGYNGYFLLLNGGFPNPTGTEYKYMGVPYNFKIYMILEAANLGFTKVFWIDAACYAVNNPDKLFDLLDNGSDSIFRYFDSNCFQPDTYKNICFPQTIDLLNKLVNRDVTTDKTVNSIVFGLNLSSLKIQSFIEQYYEMVKLGSPFLSAFPEEIVFSTIFNKDEYKYIFNNDKIPYQYLYIHESYINLENAKKLGYFFVQRSYI